MTTTFIGQPVSQVGGRQKVTGGATYTAEFNQPGQAHGAVVRSAVANGRISSIDTAAAERAPGVLVVLTHVNAPRLAYRPHKGAVDPDVGERLHVLQDDRVSHQGQPIALVIAETLEQATHAATLVRVTYASEVGTTDVTRVGPVPLTQQKSDQGETKPSETQRGDPEAALGAAEVRIDQTYVIPRENHNPIEMHATIAAWDGNRLTLWDKTQWVYNVADEIAAVFGISAENIRVISPFVGGARCPRRQAPGQADAVAARNVLWHRLPPAYGPARRRRCIPKRPPRGHCARRLPGDIDLRGVFGVARQRDPLPTFLPERVHAASHRAHERAHAHLHARPWRGKRRLRARIRDGRTLGSAQRRSGRAPTAQ